MFSGLIEHQGTVAVRSRNRLAVRLNGGFKARLGDSVAVNGVCLTVMRILKERRCAVLYFDLSAETLAKTTVGRLAPDSRVNVETALGAKDALGGHIVQGHVDGVGQLVVLRRDSKGAVASFKAPKGIMDGVVEKGSVTVDGVSLTAIQVKPTGFSVALVPFTLEHTTLGGLKKGDKVNLESDIIGKYVAKYLKSK